MQNQSPMLKAFLSQSNINDTETDERQETEKLAHDTMMQKAMLQLASSQNISDYMNVPTKLSIGELDGKVEAHKNLKGYDHSLEKTRIKFKSIKGLNTGDISDVTNDMFDGSNDVN